MGPMGLDGKVKAKLRAALIDAFPRKDDLREMLDFELDLNLDAIADGENLERVTFNLITRFEREGRLGELVAAALRAVPGNEALREAAEAIGVGKSTAEVEGNGDVEVSIARLPGTGKDLFGREAELAWLDAG